MPFLKKPSKTPKPSFNKAERMQIYQSRKWQKLRSAKLMADPLCEMCLKENRLTPAEDVHHIISFMDYSGTSRLTFAFKYDNLMSICKECHGKSHNRNAK